MRTKFKQLIPVIAWGTVLLTFVLSCVLSSLLAFDCLNKGWWICA